MLKPEMNQSDEPEVVAPSSSRPCTDYSVRSILATTSSSTGGPPSSPPSHRYVTVADLEGAAASLDRRGSDRHCADAVPPASILSELQRTVSDRTSVALTGRVGSASGADFILAPVVGAGSALRPFDMLDQRRRASAGDDADVDSGSLVGEGADGGETPAVELEHKQLWEQFATFGTEMVITKSGRLVYELQCVSLHFEQYL